MKNQDENMVTNLIVDKSRCLYLENRTAEVGYFYGYNISPDFLDTLLSNGFRRFGNLFFKNICPECRSCLPIRVIVKDFSPTKSQRRCCRVNSDLVVRFKELEYRDEIYDLYCEHSTFKFNKTPDAPDLFRQNFFCINNPGWQTEYYENGKLIGVGFIDRSINGLSSIYFIYSESAASRGLGNYSVMKEIELASELNLSYYYLGYYIEENAHMNYKNKFKPYEFF